MAYSDHEQALRVASAISAVITGCCLRYRLFASILRQPVASVDESADVFRRSYNLLRTIGLSTTEDMIHPTRTWLVCRIDVPEPVERYFLQDMYFEMAARDIRALPKLEGMVHINIALIVKFMANYFFNPAEYPEVPPRTEAVNDGFLFRQGPAKGLGKIQFHDYRTVFNTYDLPNVNRFKEQVAVFKELLARATPTEAQQKDTDFLLALGEAFTLVVYAQLILENARRYDVDDDTVDQFFDFMVRDLSKFALQLYGKLSSTPAQMDYCLKLIRKPAMDEARYQRVWSQVHALKDEYEMNP